MKSQQIENTPYRKKAILTLRTECVKILLNTFIPSHTHALVHLHFYTYIFTCTHTITTKNNWLKKIMEYIEKYSENFQILLLIRPRVQFFCCCCCCSQVQENISDIQFDFPVENHPTYSKFIDFSSSSFFFLFYLHLPHITYIGRDHGQNQNICLIKEKYITEKYIY